MPRPSQSERPSASNGDPIRQPRFTGISTGHSLSTSDPAQQRLPSRELTEAITPPTSSALPRMTASTRASQEATSQAACAPNAPPEEITGAQMISAAFERSQERDDLPFYTGKDRPSPLLESCDDLASSDLSNSRRGLSGLQRRTRAMCRRAAACAATRSHVLPFNTTALRRLDIHAVKGCLLHPETSYL